MAVDPERIQEITRATVELYRAAEAGLLDVITRHLAQGIDTPAWATERMAALGALREAAQAIVARLGADATTEILQAVAEAYREGTAAALTELPDDVATALAAQEAMSVVARTAAVESLATALVSDLGVRSSNVVRDVLDVYRTVITQATAMSVAGGLSRREAAQLAYARLVDRGVTGFTDSRGRRWRLSSYVEMGLRTVTQRAAIQGQTDKQQRLGLPYVMVSNEVQECTRCRPYEGKVLRIGPGPAGRITVAHQITGKPIRITVTAVLAEARAAGFQHPNCRHSVRAFLPGVTKLPEQPTADPAGDEARQRQRAIERSIRRWKEREAAALTREAKAQARARVRLWQGQMRDHLAANPKLKRLPYREQVGAGNIPKQRPASAAASPNPAAPKPAAPPPPAPAPEPPKQATAPAPVPQPSFADRLKDAAAGKDALVAPGLGLGRRQTPPEHTDNLEQVGLYTGPDYWAINAHLRGEPLPSGYQTSDVEPIVVGVDAAMEASTLARAIVVKRGMVSTRRMFGDRIDSDLTGMEWREDAYVSTTASDATAKRFAHPDGGPDPLIMRILVPAGTHAVAASGMDWEAEVLLARGQRMRVVADHGRDSKGVRQIDVEVLGG